MTYEDTKKPVMKNIHRPSEAYMFLSIFNLFI